MKRAAALALLVCGCHARTEMVVRVAQSGLTIPDDVQKLQMFIRDHTTGETVYSVPPTPLCGTGTCIGLPTAITLFPGATGPHDIVEVQVQALRNDAVVIDDAATFTFADGRDQEMEFILFRSCLDTHCADNPIHRTCVGGGMCDDISPTPLGSDLRVPDDGDLAPPGDLPAPVELAVPPTDLAGADLAGADLAVPNDLRTPNDLRMLMDFSPLADLIGADFASNGPVIDSVDQGVMPSGVALDWNHTVGAGPNTMLVVGVGVNGGTNITGVTCNGMMMSGLTAQRNGNLVVAFYYLKGPPVGTSIISVAISNGAGQCIAGGSISFFDVRQQAPVAHMSAGSDTSPMDAVISSPGDLIVDAVFSDGTYQSLGEGGGQTQRVLVDSGGATTSDCILGMSTMPASGGSSTTMKWALGTVAPWAIGVMDLPPP